MKQLDMFGNETDWEDATVKAQEKRSKPLVRRDKEEEVDQLVIGWLRRLDYSVSLEELADRLKPVGLPIGSVSASMKRLRKNHIIVSDGDVDPNCSEYQVLGSFRWRLGKIEDTY